MKTIRFRFLMLIGIMLVPSISHSQSSNSKQSQVNYGSNNGKYLTIKGTKIYFEEYGKGTPLLLLHGGFGSIADFTKCIPELSKKYRLVIPDSPGLGRSEFPSGPLSYQIMAEYYSTMIDQLKLDSLYVIGWSDGGNAGLLLAQQRPDKIKQLLVSGANYKASGVPKEALDGAIHSIFDVNWVQANWGEWIKNYEKLSPQDDWKRYLEEGKKMWLQEEYFSKSILEKISIPVLVVYGDHDIIMLEHGIEIKNAINNSQFCILPNTSHEVFSEKPELIDKIAIDFFARK